MLEYHHTMWEKGENGKRGKKGGKDWERVQKKGGKKMTEGEKRKEMYLKYQ